MTSMDGQQLDGRFFRLDFAEPRGSTPGSGGGRGGRGGGRGRGRGGGRGKLVQHLFGTNMYEIYINVMNI